MVFASVCFKSQTSLALLRIEKKSENYQETLASHLVPFVETFGGSDLTFQHDNPSKHVSKSTSQWLSSNMGSVLIGLALSPDLNFRENVWGKFTNLVYQNRKQYSLVEVLQLAIEDFWFELQP
ncbi:hypothetical protein AVEN_72351-1 [Araneus ventricosus]|uniref:Tc1-like transposase DDE domain-containing protein n=1 Tax=Araneus ventricosus TaxID=182803 RepID=A0A4Y2ATS8_ARAVE|nr:hypothetical protein AVEN_239589-1 [Araneus ventricosus]GBL83061.1 hypothetical protein AVEN_23950-1 [Araneus ventricosus]GBL83071.1 hypothetical protein AVEN_28152-1 [Araneus ventricosus]GBL83128.1 hypothetical protein AVEN_72351-1 [Araneus ventricosus]